jgi:class 3 adenylate cyclase/TolB-like protein/tetratricopeptide (TPR) repeat protein
MAVLQKAVERRLAAIMMTDIVGYSRLMGLDDVATLQAMDDLRRSIIDPAVVRHHGRIVKTIGDGLLVEFASVIDAVACAMAIQQGSISRNTAHPDQPSLLLRAGINLGEVVVQEGDLFGEGINIAARLERLSEPGGICLTREVRDHLQDRFNLPFADLGEQRLKNIARPVHVFGISPEVIASLPKEASGETGPMASQMSSTSRGFQALPPRLSLMVLPFTAPSDSSDQSHFAEGITETLTTDLSRIRRSFVIAPSTARLYQDPQMDLQQVGRDLGVRYMLRGSIQKSGSRLRVNAQLLDSHTGSHVWSERFDGDSSDLFGLQDQITGRIANSIDREITVAAVRDSEARRMAPDAVDCLMRGIAASYGPQSLQSVQQQEAFFRQATALDPSNSEALARLAWSILMQELPLQHSSSTEISQDRVREAAEAAWTALVHDPDNARAHLALAIVHRLHGDPKGMALESETAVALDRNLANAYTSLAMALILLGRPGEGLLAVEQAMRLDPRSPQLGVFLSVLGRAQLLFGNLEAAADCFAKAQLLPSSLPNVHAGAAMVHALLGDLDAARAATRQALDSAPDFRMSHSAFAPLAQSPDLYWKLYSEVILPAAEQANLPV